MGELKMGNDFPHGIWPTMLTPFTAQGNVDYKALENLVDWYIANGCDGLFATCQSSEIFYLSLEERVNVTKFVTKCAAGRIPVIASGHTSYDINDQITELNAIANSGVDAVILITNRLARETESDDIFIERLVKIVKSLPEDMPLGFYECPYPYKRLLTPKVINYCTASGRFYFLKDTCCDIAEIAKRLELIKGSNMRLYNANTATLTDSLKLGAAGYSGVMANFHPQLYAWLVKHWKDEPETAKEVQSILTMCSLIEMKNYPLCAKFALKLNGVGIEAVSRKGDGVIFNETSITELEQLNYLSDVLTKRLNASGK